MTNPAPRGAAPTAASAKRDKPESPRKLLRRAKELLKEARPLLKRKGERVGLAGAAEVGGAIEAVAALVPTRANGVVLDAARLAPAVARLDDALATHLGAYRKSATRELIEAVVWAVGLALIIRFFLIEAFSIPSGSMIPTLQIGDHLFINKVGYGLYIPLSPGRLIAWSQPEPGDVIVFEHRYPGDPHDGMDYIKRVIAKPGDRVRLVDDTVWVNGAPIPTKVLGEVDCPVYPNEDNAEEPVALCRCVQQEETLGGETYTTQHIVGGDPMWCQQPFEDADDWPHRERPFGAGKYFGHAAMNPEWPDVVVPDGHVFVMGDNRDRSEDGRFWGFVDHDLIKGSAFVIWWARDKGRLFSLID